MWLGRTPTIGTCLIADLPEEDLIAYLEAILRVYNEYGRRDNIYKARIKILLQALGAEEFRNKVAAEFASMDRTRYRLSPEIVDAIRARFHEPLFEDNPCVQEKLSQHLEENAEFASWVQTNTHPHKHPNYCSLTISCKPIGGVPGDVTSAQMDLLADLAERYSFGELRVTHLQNIVLGHVRQDHLFTLWKALQEHRLETSNIGLVTDTVTCPGLDYCSLANARSIPITQKLSQRFADPELQRKIGPLRLNISGCINACGHHHVGHIGILGVDKHGTEAFQITLGGNTGNQSSIGQILGSAMSEDETVEAITRIIETYLVQRHLDESFIETYRRLGTTPFKEAAYAVA